MPMSRQSQVYFWLAAGFGALVFLIVFRSVLLPFIAGAALAYLLDPLVDWLERIGVRRLAGTITIAIVVLFGMLFALVAVVPILANQMVSFFENLPSYADRLNELLAPIMETRFARLIGINPDTVEDQIRTLIASSTGSITTVLASLWSGGRAVVDIIALGIVTPVVAFYLLYDWDRMITRLDQWLPRDHAATVRDLARQIDEAIAGFVRGQALVIAILGTFYAVGLVAIGLNFGLFIGFSAGVLSFIPYVGTTIGFVISLVVAFVQFWPGWEWVAATAAIFIAGQFLEGNFLQPYLVGQSVGVHPVWLMFALFAFGLLFGFVGLLLAVPAAAAIAVLARYALSRYLVSSYYLGSRKGQDSGQGE